MKIGLSLAISSADSDRMNRNKNSHSDQKPRALDLKFCQRRALIGENSKPRGRKARPSGPAGSASGISSRISTGLPSVAVAVCWARVLSSTSHLARFEIDARIDPRIGEVGDQINDEAD